MRGETLSTLVRKLRVEVGHSTTAAHGLNTEDHLKERLRMGQEWLWENYDWEHLDVSRDIQLQAGQRIYDGPADMIADRIHSVSFKYSNEWLPLTYGINPEDFGVYDSDQDVRSWPIYKWNFAEGSPDPTGPARIEVWPIPAITGDVATKVGYIRVQGIRNLNPFTDNAHKCDLDGNLIVLHTAAKIVARQSQRDAERLVAEGEALRRRLQGNGSRKQKQVTFNDRDDVGSAAYRQHRHDFVHIPPSG